MPLRMPLRMLRLSRLNCGAENARIGHIFRYGVDNLAFLRISRDARKGRFFRYGGGNLAFFLRARGVMPFRAKKTRETIGEGVAEAAEGMPFRVRKGGFDKARKSGFDKFF